MELPRSSGRSGERRPVGRGARHRDGARPNPLPGPAWRGVVARLGARSLCAPALKLVDGLNAATEFEPRGAVSGASNLAVA